ncbi:potassium channel family protein [Geodermatophilus sp. SYSU D00779]
MTGVLGWFVTAVGAALVFVALRDIFHTIWHPTGRGGLSRRLMATVWRIGRRRRALGALVGPLAMVVVVLAWVLLILLGWALVYWPHLPGGFVFGSGLDPASRAGFLDAVYLSTVTLATLGFGDIVPAADWLRIAVPVQALVGFGLITAAVSWVLQVYPALTRRRALAVRLSLLRRVDTLGLVADPQSAMAAPLLEDLAVGLAQLRVDLTQYAETYYFRDGDPEASLPAMLGVALHLSEHAQRTLGADARYAGELLDTAVGDYLHVVDEQFLHVGGPARAIASAYADDHGQELARAR